jgi:hypothetical protein
MQTQLWGEKKKEENLAARHSVTAFLAFGYLGSLKDPWNENFFTCAQLVWKALPGDVSGTHVDVGRWLALLHQKSPITGARVVGREQRWRIYDCSRRRKVYISVASNEWSQTPLMYWPAWIGGRTTQCVGRTNWQEFHAMCWFERWVVLCIACVTCHSNILDSFCALPATFLLYVCFAQTTTICFVKALLPNVSLLQTLMILFCAVHRTGDRDDDWQPWRTDIAALQPNVCFS